MRDNNLDACRECRVSSDRHRIYLAVSLFFTASPRAILAAAPVTVGPAPSAVVKSIGSVPALPVPPPQL